ncbi:MAG: hypothetical protein IT371_14555 [Deltaproteobacteria bacterium]|nr:hypothetical protein [Deltaproteobacteria bacterium]
MKTARASMLTGTCLLALGLAACGKASTTADQGTPKSDAGATVDAKGATSDGAVAGGDASVPTGACAPDKLAAEALLTGKKILNGVAGSTASTPLADLIKDPTAFNGKFVRIEGKIVEICDEQGCYVTLGDAKGNKVNLKTVDGTVDFRTITKVGRYAVGEGTYGGGSHGSQVDIMKHGAMLGNVDCP